MSNHENLFAKNFNGETPLCLAVLYNRFEVVEIICNFVSANQFMKEVSHKSAQLAIIVVLAQVI